MHHIYIVTGQTGTGKTGYALSLAKKINGEIVSADSRQIYRYLDIITGKDFVEKNFVEIDRLNNHIIGYYTIDEIKVWGYDIVDPKENFSSHDFREVAHRVIDIISKAGKIPIIVGGSHLYIKDLVCGFDTAVPPNWELRSQLELLSVSQLQDKLIKLNKKDYTSLNNSDKNNPRRLIRKIELCLDSANPKVEPQTTSRVDYHINEYIGFRFKNKDKLHVAIKKRVDKRLEQGAIEEVRQLLRDGYSKNDPGLQTIGYQEIISYLEGSLSKEEMVKKWITSEIQYAKRQLTFMKKDENIIWKAV